MMDMYIQERSMQKTMVHFCLEKLAVIGRIIMPGILQWLAYVIAVIQILLSDGHG